MISLLYDGLIAKPSPYRDRQEILKVIYGVSYDQRMKATKQVKKLAREIFSIDPNIQHQGILDLEGHVLLDQSSASSEPMEPDEDRIMFYYQVALRRTRRDYYNKTYGETTYVHIVRKKIQQLIIYLSTFTIYLTIDNKVTPPAIAKMAEKIHAIDNDLLDEAITSTMYR